MFLRAYLFKYKTNIYIVCNFYKLTNHKYTNYTLHSLKFDTSCTFLPKSNLAAIDSLWEILWTLSFKALIYFQV